MRKKRYLALLFAFVAIMILVTVFGENGLLDVYRLKQQLERLTEINQSIRLENADLLEEIEFLRNHEGYLELQAHKQGLLKEDEIVFQFRSDD